ncbi:unnamed protein product [Calypogeia fissa]
MASIDKNGSTEKEVGFSTSIAIPAAGSQVSPIANGASDLDRAFKYLQNVSHIGDVDTSSVDLAALRRRIDLRILPVMCLCIFMLFLDKVNLNYAAVMGLTKDLKLRGDDFSNAATALYIAFLVSEVPNGFLLQRVPVAKWLGGTMIVWGIVTACTAATKDYTGLLTVRIFLGVFEASTAPCLMLISSQWYTRSEQIPRFTVWYCGNAIAQMIGGVISYGFQFLGPRDSSLAGWRIMFLVLGIVTVLVGFLAGWTLPDTPMAAKWLDNVEKVALLNHVGENRTGIKNHHFKISQLVELLLDVQMWLMIMITVLTSISGGLIITYSTTVIRNFGFSPKVSALLNTPSGAVSLIVNIIVAYGVRSIPRGHRWAWIFGCSLCGVGSGAILSFAPSTDKASMLFGIYLSSCTTPTLILIEQWAMTNVAGQTKRAFASTLVVGSICVGSIIGPETFRAKDAPQYHSAKIILLGTQAGAAILTLVLLAYYVWANLRKDERQRRLLSEGVQINSLEHTWGNLTDKENVEFRYAY